MWLGYITKTRATRTTTTITNVSINANPSIALMKNNPPNSGAYASALSNAAKIKPTPTAQPPKGKESRPRAKHFKALKNITIPTFRRQHTSKLRNEATVRT